ncbi:hypothetical protein M3Y94_01084100 [Aphelenchoides besseyi]|nr:hypothetical protein M3Y94_01084100 [Aphelenchoides besseyi]KAI6221772.1 hypothetical protein M3Y95_00997300 [Aphelenchoides besseyi]
MSSRLFVFFVLICGVDAKFKILYVGNDSFPLHSDQLHYWNKSQLVTRVIADQISFIPVVKEAPNVLIVGVSFDSMACLGGPNIISVDVGSCSTKLVFSVSDGECMLAKVEGSVSVLFAHDSGPNKDYLLRNFHDLKLGCKKDDWVEINEIDTTSKRIKVTLRTSNDNTGVEFLMEVEGYGYSDDQNDLATFIVLCVMTGLMGLLISSSIFAVVRHRHFIKPKRQQEASKTSAATPAKR